jgi:hypothetical protein
VQRGLVIFKCMNKYANILVRQNRIPVLVTHYVMTQLAYLTGLELRQSRGMLRQYSIAVETFTKLYVQVTVHRDKLRIKQPTRCIKYPKFILS